MNSPSDINSRNATPAGGQNESINSSPVHGPRPARIDGWPKVAGYCPACGTASLFLGSGGWVTCSLDKCPNPTAVADLIEHRPDLSVPAPQPNPSDDGPEDRIDAALEDVANSLSDAWRDAAMEAGGEPPRHVDVASLARYILADHGRRLVADEPATPTCGRSDHPTSSCQHTPDERRPVVSSARVDLDEIERRVTHLDSDEYNQGVPKNAPWRAHASCSGRDRWVIYQPTGSDQSRVITEGLRQPFADFIAHAREDVPALVGALRSAYARIAELEAACRG